MQEKITRKEAAELLGYSTTQAVSNLLRGRKAIHNDNEYYYSPKFKKGIDWDYEIVNGRTTIWILKKAIERYLNNIKVN